MGTAIFNIIVGLAIGLVFGFALEKGRVFEPGMIVGQFQLRNWIMVKMFLSAIITGMVAIVILSAVGRWELSPKAAVFPATIGGGLLFGAGMALAGACPGTVLAQIGAGYRDAWLTVLGGLAGAVAYGYLQPTFKSWNAGPGKVALPELTGMPFWVLALIAVVVMIAILVGLEKWRPWRDELGKDYDGQYIPAPTEESVAGPGPETRPNE